MANGTRESNVLADLVREINPLRPLRVVGRLVRRSLKAPGSAPGTVVHTGPRRMEEVRLTAFRFDGKEVYEGPWSPDEAVGQAAAVSDGVLWVNVDGLHDVALLEKIGARMGFHPLVVEDIANVGQRPKVEEYDDHLFVVLHMLSVEENPLRVMDEQVSLVLGRGYLFSFQESPGDVWGPVRDRIRSGKGRLPTRGADYLAYSLIDALVDHYFQTLERIGTRTEELETEVLDSPDRQTMHQIHELRHELLVLRRSLWPLRDMLGAFLRSESPIIEGSTRVFLRDVHDHAFQLIESVDVLRDVSSGMRDLYLSNISNRTNEVMKVLTIMSSIFIPLTFVAGVYGMNFRFMPELEVPWAYPAVLIGMSAVAMGMVWYFRRKGWI